MYQRGEEDAQANDQGRFHQEKYPWVALDRRNQLIQGR